MPNPINTKRLFSVLGLGALTLAATVLLQSEITHLHAAEEAKTAQDKNTATAIFAGGCFWCMEADFDKLDGVTDVVSGYSGGSADTATYKQVSYEETGHFEVVEVSYNPDTVSYPELLEYYWRQVDPTDSTGQFCDKGSSYKTAIFYQTDQQKAIIDASLENLEANKPFDAPIVTEILPAKPFYAAEPRHQNYYQRNPIRYKFYRNGCGRDQRLKEIWGE